jgi:hypothetical protein
VVAVAAVVDEADLAVEPLELAVGQAQVDSGQELVAVAADGARQVQHGRDAGAAGAGEPGVQVGVGTAAWGQPVQVAQRFLQDPGAEQDMAGAAQLGDRLALAVGPASRVFQQRPAGVFDQLGSGVLADAGQRSRAGDPGGAAGAVPGGPADLVHRGVGQLG